MHEVFSRRHLLICAGALLAAAKRSIAQQDTTFSADVKVVNLLATVRNKHGQIVKDLNKDDFVLSEDGRPQSIRYFSRETDLPLTVGLLVDTSGSMRREVGKERLASYRFFEQVLREGTDQAFVIHFDREVELLQDLTSSRQKLEKALDLLEEPSDDWRGGRRSGGGYGGRGGHRGGFGGTALYDAVLLACDELMRKQNGRKALILLSDGDDNGSKVGLSEAIESAQRGDTLVYTILFTGTGFSGFGRAGFGGRGGRFPSERTDGRKVMQRIARETGASSFTVSEKQAVSADFSTIEEELRNQYSLGYTSDRAEGAGFRHLALTTKQKDVVAQTREGYYAK